MSPKAAKRSRVPGWRADQPYNRLPPLPPKADLESRPILKHCITARAALAELKQAAELIPNQGMLINTLPLLEARASSEIENIVTTTDRLFQFREDDEHADPATKEALRYSYALLEGYRGVRALQSEELRALPVEGAFVCLRFATTRLTDFSLRTPEGTPPVRHYQRFLARLEALEQGALTPLIGV